MGSVASSRKPSCTRNSSARRPKPKDLVGLIGKSLQGQRKLRQCGLEREKFVAVFLQKFTAVLKLETAFARRKRGKEQLRALVDTACRRQQRRRCKLVLLHRPFHVAQQVLHPQIADADAEVAAGHVLQLVSLVEDHHPGFGQNAGIGRALGCLLHRQVGEEQDDG